MALRSSVWIVAVALVGTLTAGCAPAAAPAAPTITEPPAVPDTLVAAASPTPEPARAQAVQSPAAPEAAGAATTASGAHSAAPQPTPWPTVPAPDYWPTHGWRSTAPEAQGLSSAGLARVFDTIREKKAGFSSLLVVRHGYLVAEAYFNPTDFDDRPELYSVTKSFISALVGIAIAEGRIPGLQTPVLDFFPGRTIAQRDSRKEAMTLENLLTMTSGLEWPEINYTRNDGQSPFDRMLRSRDWAAFVLDQPMALPPGQTFNYNSGASHLLSAILQERTGQTANKYAQTRLFEPLGIADATWLAEPAGRSIGGWGLHVRPRDAAKLGLLYLNGGTWEGRQLVPADWVAGSVARHVDTGDGHGYGYQWWIFDFGAYAAQGRFGQFIMVLPGQDMLVVATANLPDADAATTLPDLVRDLIIPAAKGPGSLPADPAGAARLQEAIRAATQ